MNWVYAVLFAIAFILAISLPGSSKEEITGIVDGLYCRINGGCTLQTLNITNTTTGSSNLIYNNGTHLIITGNGCFGDGC